MLNALTLQMLAGDRYLDDLLGAGRSLYTKTLLMQVGRHAVCLLFAVFGRLEILAVDHPR